MNPRAAAGLAGAATLAGAMLLARRRRLPRLEGTALLTGGTG